MDEFCGWLNVPKPGTVELRWFLKILAKHWTRIWNNHQQIRTWFLSDVELLSRFDAAIIKRGSGYNRDIAFLKPLPKPSEGVANYLRTIIIGNYGKNVMAFERWDIVDLLFSPKDFIRLILPQFLTYDELGGWQCEALIRYQTGLSILTPRDRHSLLDKIVLPTYQTKRRNSASKSGAHHLLTANIYD